ncbi:MAG TPA: hypothetical protein PK720_00670 [bacterium]|nr:hypothetical protein [bacterium]
MSHPFFSWKARQSFILSMISFVLGFIVAWLMCSDTFQYMFALMFAT